MNQLLTETLSNLNHKKALIPFITAGYPDPKMTLPIMHCLVENGADVIELGMPFSDPMADGPVIQKASEQAIKQGTGLKQTLQMVYEFRQTNQTTPIVLMGYLNPIESMGYEVFVEQAARAGVNAVLLVDSPPEESADIQTHLKAHNMQQIYLVAPTTSAQRKQLICDVAAGFIYYVALKGVTGAADLNTDAVNHAVKALKATTQLPVAVGFGVKDADSAVAVAREADAVVIGSALIKTIDAAADNVESVLQQVGEFMRPICAALDSL